MDISIVIPLLNEAESLPELHAWIKKVMDEHGFTYEILFIDDGSKDNSWEIIAGLAAQNPSVVGIRFRRNYGKSAALNVGFARTKGRVVFTMDADLQDSPDELPGLYHRIIDEKFHLISGWKKKRFDPITKTIPTKLFNYATRMMSGIKLHDFNCGLKAYSSEVVKNVEVSPNGKDTTASANRWCSTGPGNTAAANLDGTASSTDSSTCSASIS